MNPFSNDSITSVYGELLKRRVLYAWSKSHCDLLFLISEKVEGLEFARSGDDWPEFAQRPVARLKVIDLPKAMEYARPRETHSLRRDERSHDNV